MKDDSQSLPTYFSPHSNPNPGNLVALSNYEDLHFQNEIVILLIFVLNNVATIMQNRNTFQQNFTT